MAQYGAKGFRVAPFAASDPEPANALPKYGTIITLDGVVSVTETINKSTAEGYGDNVRKIRVEEFTDGMIDLECLYLSQSDASKILGLTLDSTEKKNLYFKDNDNAPYCGGAFYVSCIKSDGSNERYHKGIYYPKIKGSMSGATYQTKQKQLTLANPKLSFSLDACNSHDYRIESEEFATEAQADAWCTAMLSAAT